MQAVSYDIPFGSTWTLGNVPNNSVMGVNSIVDSSGQITKNSVPYNAYGTATFGNSDVPYSNSEVDAGVTRMAARGFRNVRVGFSGFRFLETNPNASYGSWGPSKYATWEGKHADGNAWHPAAIDRANYMMYKLRLAGISASVTNNAYGELLTRVGIRQGTFSGTGMFWLFTRARDVFFSYMRERLERQNPYLSNQTWGSNPDIESWQANNEEGLKDTIFRSDTKSFGGGFQVRLIGATKANPGVFTTVGDHIFAPDDRVTISGMSGMTQVSGTYKINTVPTARTFTLKNASTGVPLDTTSFGTWTSSSPAIGGMIYTKTGDIGGNPFEITGISKANPGVITTRYNHDAVVDELIYIQGVEGMTEINGQYKVNTTPAANTLTLKTLAGTPVNTTSYGTWVATIAANGGLVEDEKTTTHWCDQLVDLNTANGREWKAEADALIQTRFAAHGWTVPTGGTNGGGWPTFADMNNPAIYSTGVGGDREHFLQMIEEIEIEYLQAFIDLVREYNPNVTIVLADNYITFGAKCKVNRSNLAFGRHIYQGSWDDTNFHPIVGSYKQRGSIFADNCNTDFVNGSNSYWRNAGNWATHFGGSTPSNLAQRITEDGNYGDSNWTYESYIMGAVIGLLQGTQVNNLVGEGQQKQWATAVTGTQTNIHNHRRRPGFELAHILCAPMYNHRWITPQPAHITYITNQEYLNIARNDAGNISGDCSATSFNGNVLQRYLIKRLYCEIAGTSNYNSGTWPANPMNNWSTYQATTAANPINVQSNGDSSNRVMFHGRGMMIHVPNRMDMWMNEVPQNSTLGVITTGAMTETVLNAVLAVRSNGDYNMFTNTTVLFYFGPEYMNDTPGFSAATSGDGEGSNTVYNIIAFDKTTGEIQLNTAHSLAVNDLITIRGVNAPTTLNSPKFKVNSVPASDKLTLKDWSTGVPSDFSGGASYTSGGTLRKSNIVTGWGSYGSSTQKIQNPEATPISLATGRDCTIQVWNGTAWVTYSKSYSSGVLSFTTDPLYPVYVIDPIPDTSTGNPPIVQKRTTKRKAYRSINR